MQAISISFFIFTILCELIYLVMILFVYTQVMSDFRQKPVYILHYWCDPVASKGLTDLILIILNIINSIMMLSDTGYKTGDVFPWKEFLIVPPLPFFF